MTFDAAGTLFGLSEPVGRTYGRIGRAHGAVVTDAALEAAFRPAFARMRPLTRDARGWWRELVTKVFADAGAAAQPAPAESRTDSRPAARSRFDLDRCFDELYQLFGTAAAWAVSPEVEQVLATLRDTGLRLGVISNFDCRVEPLLRDLGLRRYFASVTVSSRVGAAKPDRSIFAAAARALAIDVAEILHVGDDPRDDFEGATAAGMRALLVDREARRAPTEIPTVTDLTGVVAEVRRLKPCAGAPQS